MKTFLHYHYAVSNFYFILLACLLLSSCQEGGNKTARESESVSQNDELSQQIVALYDTVMKIHDEVMPKTGYMQDLKKDLKSLSDPIKPETQAIIDSLTAADSEMMDWMHEFTPPKKEDYNEKTLDLLKIEVEKIKEVARKINVSIADADGYLENYIQDSTETN